MAKVSQIHLPHYHVKTKPDSVAVGEQIDAHLREQYSGDLVVRAISMQEKKEPIDVVVDQILRHGTDLINPNQSGRGYGGEEKIDFYGVSANTQRPIAQHFVQKFHDKPLLKGELPLRTDLYIIYDPKKVAMVPHEREGKQKKYGFRFKPEFTKQDALLGIVKVL